MKLTASRTIEIGTSIILYRDADVVAVYKPAGMLVHRSRVAPSATQFLLQEVRNLVGSRVHLVNRLDRQTAGVVLLALTPEAASALSRQFADRVVRKTYLALVRGFPADEGLIDHPVRPARDRRAGPDRTQEAQTAFRTIATSTVEVAIDRYARSRYALVALYPVTGRRHQLRLHMRHIRHPIIGDRKYGDRHHNRHFLEAMDRHRLMLVSLRLAFRHPTDGRPINVSAPPDAGFAFGLIQAGLEGRVPDVLPDAPT